MVTSLFSIEESQSIWFIQLRWIAVGMGILMVTLFWIFSGVLMEPMALMASFLGLAGLNAGYSFYQSRLAVSAIYSFEKHKKINDFLRIQIAGDLVILFLLLLFSGGLQNPLFYLYLLHVVIASILFQKKESLGYVFVISLFPLALYLLAWAQWTPTHLNFMDEHFEAGDEMSRLVVFWVVAGGIWLIVSRIAQEIRGAELKVKTSEEVLSKTKMDLASLESHRRQLLTNLAKELSHPLRWMIGHFENMEQHIEKGERLEAWGAYQKFKNEINGLETMAEDLEWLSEPHWPQKAYQKERVDLMTLAAKEIARKEKAALEKKLQVKLVGPKRLLLSADRWALLQIFSQLLSNSIKYSSLGSGDIVLTIERQVPFALISIADHGMGISEDEKDGLFQQFFRSRHVEKLETSGSGLGLYIVKKIVDWHRGMVQVESVWGKGTTIKVWLPLEQNVEGTGRVGRS